MGVSKFQHHLYDLFPFLSSEDEELRYEAALVLQDAWRARQARKNRWEAKTANTAGVNPAEGIGVEQVKTVDVQSKSSLQLEVEAQDNQDTSVARKDDVDESIELIDIDENKDVSGNTGLNTSFSNVSLTEDEQKYIGVV